MSGDTYGGDGIDFSHGAFRGEVVGKKVEHHHHYGPMPHVEDALPPTAAAFTGRENELAALLAERTFPRYAIPEATRDGGKAAHGPGPPPNPKRHAYRRTRRGAAGVSGRQPPVRPPVPIPATAAPPTPT